MRKTAGLDGVVCSPLEAGEVHAACGAGFLTVTPGVRFADGDVGDQVRITTPARAKEIGSDYIVVGRPVTQAADPVAAYERARWVSWDKRAKFLGARQTIAFPLHNLGNERSDSRHGWLHNKGNL